jgi:repressor LexA
VDIIRRYGGFGYFVCANCEYCIVGKIMEASEEPEKTVRPSKKQRELLAFIDGFIQEHGYSPSYREIMNGCEYTSVATVSLHVNNLIKRGHLKKRDRSARSLEVVQSDAPEPALHTNQVKEADEKWLIEKIDHQFKIVEEAAFVPDEDIAKLQTLIDALKILDLDGAAQSYQSRLQHIHNEV